MAPKHKQSNGDEMIRNSQASEALAENPQYQDDITALKASLGVTSDMVKADIGFPPYWKADIGKGFRGVVLMRDERDPDFVRYHIENTGPMSLECRQGKIDDGEIIDVDRGSIFTCSAYGALPLDRFFGLEVTVIVKGSRKLAGNAASKNVPRDLFEFDVLVSKEVNELLKSRRTEDAQHLAAVQQAAKRKALEEIAAINARRLAQKASAPVLTTGAPA